MPTLNGPHYQRSDGWNPVIDHEDDNDCVGIHPEPYELVWIADVQNEDVLPGYWTGGWWESWTGSDDISVVGWKLIDYPHDPVDLYRAAFARWESAED